MHMMPSLPKIDRPKAPKASGAIQMWQNMRQVAVTSDITCGNTLISFLVLEVDNLASSFRRPIYQFVIFLLFDSIQWNSIVFNGIPLSWMI